MQFKEFELKINESEITDHRLQLPFHRLQKPVEERDENVLQNRTVLGEVEVSQAVPRLQLAAFIRELLTTETKTFTNVRKSKETAPTVYMGAS